MDQGTSDKERIIERADGLGEFVTDVDGFVYYWPSFASGGHFSAHTLRTIADELDRRNEKWNAYIEEYFRGSRDYP